MSQLTLRVDGTDISVRRGARVVAAARKAGVDIPTLCHNDKLKPAGACRLCHVDVTTSARPETLMAACATAAENGMVVRTDTERVAEARRFIFALLLARSPDPPKLVAMARKYGVELKADSDDPLCAFLHQRAEARRAAAEGKELSWCILCGQCVRVCAEVVGMRAIGTAYRGPRKKIATPYFDISPTCIGCGSCAYVCPTDAITISPAE